MTNGVSTGVQLEGAGRLRATLKRAGADMTQMKSTHKEIAGIIVSAASPPSRTNRLAQSMRAGATQSAAIARAGGNGAKAVKYANPIHWGWFKRHIRPNPFLSLAAQRSEPTWFAVYAREVEKILGKIEGA